MYIHGSFTNQQGDTVTVHIVANNDRMTEKEIGTETAGLYFTDDPIEINTEVNDTFDHLLRQSATIRLFCRDFMTDLFSTSCRDVIVNIYKNDKCVFAGFVEPQTYSQPYNEVYDELEVNCIDVLSALQYSKYKDVCTLGVLYSVVKNEAGQRSFKDIIVEILNGITQNLDIVNGTTVQYLYDGSKSISRNVTFSIFSQLTISELLFLGNEEDDVWQQDEVIEEILRYLNLHIVQDGFVFYIFSWETVTNDDVITWRNIIGAQNTTMQRNTVVIATEIAVDCDTQISIGEVYNQLLLTCKIEGIESVIESPLDDDLLVSPYSNKQKYCTEYSSDGEGKTAYNAFYAMTHDTRTTYGGGSITDWYVQVMNNTQWSFPKNGGSTDLINYFCASGKNQHALPDWMGLNPGAAILSLGSVKMNTANDDNSPTSKVSMTNYLVVSVNGNEIDNDETNTYPSEAALKANIPYAVYNGNSAGGTFSPSDDEITNYIVFSGKVILNPIMKMTHTYRDLHNKEWESWPTHTDKLYVWHQTVPSRTNGDGRYYTRKYWRATSPSYEVSWGNTDYGLTPFSGEGPQQYEFKYSAVGDSTDQISKIAVLACMLIIGDKCLVEKQPGEYLGTSTAGTGNGQIDDFVWRTYKTREQCSSDDEYYQQSFTIGFDPKIGDKLVGTEFDLQNNIDYTLGIDAEGIAVPIRRSDKVSGVVKFMILGPVNTTWDVITRRHPTFFRHTKWSTSTVPLLAHVSSIMIKSFEVKVYSDNGLINTNQTDNDVIYMSDTKETFTNRKDDLEFKISSALTAAECRQLGVTNTVKLSTPLNTVTGDGVLSIYDSTRMEQAKPEQFYVDSYYNEYHKPRIQMEQNLKDIDGMISYFHHYRHPALNKSFYVVGIGRNLIEGSAHLMLKEIWQ